MTATHPVPKQSAEPGITEHRPDAQDNAEKTKPEPLRSGKRRLKTMRFRLVCLVIACILPVCLIAGVLVYHSYRQKQLAMESSVLDTARALSMVFDRELVTMQLSMNALATSPALQTGDLGTFYRQAQLVLRDYPGGDIILADATGQQLLNSYLPFGTPLPRRNIPDAVRGIYVTGKPFTSNLFKGAVTGRPLISVDVPVFRGDRVVYDLALTVPADRLKTVLSQQHISPEWTVSIYDRNFVIVARNRFPERYVGMAGNPVALKRIADIGEGSMELPNKEGTPIVAMFSQSKSTGWTVSVGIPKAELVADIWQSLRWVLAGIALLLIVGIVLALHLAVRIANSIHALIPPALALGSGEPVDVGQLDLVETSKVGQSLVKASELLQQRLELEHREADARAEATKLSAIIEERKAGEEVLHKLNRALNAYSHSGQALLHAESETVLLERICKIVTEDCGYAMTWIGVGEDDEGKTVRPVAQAGFEEGYLETLRITWADTERGRGPTGTAMRTGRPCGCRNVLTDPDFAPWREEALARGYASSLALPLLDNGKPFGAITIYGSGVDAFSADEVNLLSELAADLSYGISTIRARAAHRQAEEELGQNRKWLSVTLSSIGDAVLSTDIDGRITFLNPVASALIGWPAEKAIGQPFQTVFRIINEHTRKPGEDIVARVLEVGHAVDLANHTVLLAKDGREIPIEDSAAPILDSEGNAMGVVLVFHDVTERRRAEEALRQSEERFRLALRNAPVSVAIQNTDLRYIWAYNQRTDPSEGILGKLDEDIFTPAEARRIGEIKRRVLREDIEIREQMWLRRPSGPMFLDVSFVPVRDQQGRVQGVGCATVDLTAMKLAEEKLRFSEEKFAKAFAINPTAIVLSRFSDGLILDVNESFVAMYGLARDEVIGKSASQFWPAKEERARIVQELRERGVLSNREQIMLRSSGQTFVTLLSAAILSVGTEELILSTWMDITERKRTEEALVRSEKLASVGRMAATIAHEINNPLAAITNTLFLAKTMENLPASARQYLETADEELRRVAHITRQSLGFYRELNAPTLVSLNALLESTLELLKNKIKAKQVIIEKQWDADVKVVAVAGELRQVFSNLLANSLDAIDSQGTIKLRVSSGTSFSTGGRSVRVIVADDGTGISSSARQHLFEPFFTTKASVGTGLGLWVSKQLVHKHNGSIRVRSSTHESSHGTVVSVVLPVDPAAADQTAGKYAAITG